MSPGRALSAAKCSFLAGRMRRCAATRAGGAGHAGRGMPRREPWGAATRTQRSYRDRPRRIAKRPAMSSERSSRRSRPSRTASRWTLRSRGTTARANSVSKRTGPRRHRIYRTRVKRDALEGLRTHAWPVIALAAVGVFLVGLLVLSGSAQAIACVAAAVVFLIACLRVLDTETYRKRDAGQPRPPWGSPPV
jgi:Flp pilus assembly protein TadB